MYAIDKLIAAGMEPREAFDTVFFYLEQKKEKELERYICEMERGQRRRPNN